MKKSEGAIHSGRALRWLLPVVLVFAAGFVVASIWDLPIDQALYSPQNPFAILMECFGWYTAFLPAPLLLLSLFFWLILARPGVAAVRPQSRGVRLLFGVLAIMLAVTACFVLLYSSAHDLARRGWLVDAGSGKAVFLAVGTLLLVGMLLAGVGMLWGKYHRQLLFVAVFGTAFLAVNQAVIQLLKWIWDRTRFDDMVAAGSFADFTVWFRPFANGGTSFPSGHTANAAGIFVLIILCDLFLAWDKKRRLVYGICWGYIALMAFARVLIGRHFLSDTLAAAGLMALVFWGIRRLDIYQKTVARLRPGARENNTGTDEETVGGNVISADSRV